MLVYQPAFDLYHACYRMAKLLLMSGKNEYEMNHFRQLDYFLAFPSEIPKIKTPIEYKSYKKMFKKNKYQQIVDSQLAFEQLKPYQDAAFGYLISCQAIDEAALRNNQIKLRSNTSSSDIFLRINEIPLPQAVEDFVVNVLLVMPFDGPLGLKDRSPIKS